MRENEEDLTIATYPFQEIDQCSTDQTQAKEDKLAPVEKTQVADQLKKFLEEVDTKFEAKIETFKAMCMDASRSGYLKGRREADSGGPDDSWLTVPQQVLQLAMELKYIDLKLVDFNPPKNKKRKP